MLLVTGYFLDRTTPAWEESRLLFGRKFMGRKILKTKLCDMLGIEYPILSAGMGPPLIGETTGAPVELVVAVSEAGGVGVLGGAGFTVDGLREAIREIKTKTKKPYGVDLL